MYQQCAKDRTYLWMMGRTKGTFQDEDKWSRVWWEGCPLTLVIRLLVRWPKPGMVSPLCDLQPLNGSPQSLVNGMFPHSTNEKTKARRWNGH